MKNLYKGVFNFKCEVHVLRAYAYSERQAWLILCRRLAKKHGVSPVDVMNHFSGEQGNYKVGLEVEFQEERE
jgi:hypothetical protein